MLVGIPKKDSIFIGRRSCSMLLWIWRRCLTDEDGDIGFEEVGCG